MKLRIMGTSEEVKQLTELLPAIMNVSSVSGEYPNRDSNDVRVSVNGTVEEYPDAIQQNAEYGLVVVKPESLVDYMKPYNKKPSYKSSAQRNDLGRGTMAYSSGYQDGQGFGTQLHGGN